jgi:hypothetical protein
MTTLRKLQNFDVSQVDADLQAIPPQTNLAPSSQAAYIGQDSAGFFWFNGAKITTGASTWDTILSALANLTLNNAGFTTTYNQTSPVNWTWANTTAATSGGVITTYASNSSATTSTILSLNIAIGDCVIICANGSTQIPTATDNGTGGGNTYANLATNSPFKAFSLISATKTATTITVSVSAGTIAACAVLYHSGTFNIGSLGVVGANAAAIASSALLPSNANSQVLLLGVGSSASSAESVSAGFTIQSSAGPNSGSSISYAGLATWNTPSSTLQGISGTFTCTSSILTQAIAVEILGVNAANVSTSPIINLDGTYWNGASSAADIWTIQNAQTSAINGQPILKIAHSGSSGISNIEADTNVAIVNTAVGTVATTNNSSALQLSANAWNGTISIPDVWTAQSSLTASTNGNSTLNVTHAGSTGPAKLVVPAMSFSSPVVASPGSTLFGFGGTGINNSSVCLNVTGGSQACMDWALNGTIGLSCLTGYSVAADIGIFFNTYLGNSTVGAGMPSLVAKSNLTAQAAAASSITIYAVPNTATRTRPGMYRIAYCAAITQAATTSCTLGGANGFQVIYTDINDSVVKTSNPTTPVISSVNATGTTISGDVYAYAKLGTNIQYSFGYTSSGATAMQYDLNVYVEFLG